MGLPMRNGSIVDSRVDYSGKVLPVNSGVGYAAAC